MDELGGRREVVCLGVTSCIYWSVAVQRMEESPLCYICGLE